MVVREGEHNAYVNASLSDTWKFALKSQRWIQIEVRQSCVYNTCKNQVTFSFFISCQGFVFLQIKVNFS